MRRLKRGEQLMVGDAFGHPDREFVPASSAPISSTADQPEDEKEDGFYRFEPPPAPPPPAPATPPPAAPASRRGRSAHSGADDPQPE